MGQREAPGGPDRRKELQAEYLAIQGQYEDFDKRVLGLKGLATPLLGAGLAAGAREDLAIVVWATVLVAVALWALETTWKAFQYCYQPRLVLLEAWFAGAAEATSPYRPAVAVPDDLEPFQIFQAWNREWEANWRRKPAAFLRVSWEPMVCLPYVLIIGGGVAILVWLATRSEAGLPT